MNIILIGYRGVGKSAVSEILAKKLNIKKISTDNLIKQEVGNLQEFIKLSGWNEFRKMETSLLKTLNTENSVIDCGGGIVEQRENIDILKNLGKVFYLYAEPETIKKRLETSGKRLALTENKTYFEEIKDILKKRSPLYKDAADFVIYTDDKTINQTVEKICRKIRYFAF